MKLFDSVGLCQIKFIKKINLRLTSISTNDALNKSFKLFDPNVELNTNVH